MTLDTTGQRPGESYTEINEYADPEDFDNAINALKERALSIMGKGPIAYRLFFQKQTEENQQIIIQICCYKPIPELIKALTVTSKDQP